MRFGIDKDTKIKCKIEVVYHYEKESGIDGDEAEIDVFVNDELATTFGDYYHDKGAEKLEGFLEALRWIGFNIECNVKHIADVEW